MKRLVLGGAQEVDEEPKTSKVSELHPVDRFSAVETERRDAVCNLLASQSFNQVQLKNQI